MRAGVEDVVFCYLRFPSGLAAHMHLSWLDPHKERRFTVVGSKQMATFDDMALERKLTVYDKGFDQDFAPTASTSPARATSGARASRTRSRCGSSAGTSSSACATAASRARARERACASCACWRRCSARSRSALRGAGVLQPSDRAPGLLLGEGVELPDDVLLGGGVVVHAPA